MQALPPSSSLDSRHGVERPPLPTPPLTSSTGTLNYLCRGGGAQGLGLRFSDLCFNLGPLGSALYSPQPSPIPQPQPHITSPVYLGGP